MNEILLSSNYYLQRVVERNETYYLLLNDSLTLPFQTDCFAFFRLEDYEGLDPKEKLDNMLDPLNGSLLSNPDYDEERNHIKKALGK